MWEELREHPKNSGFETQKLDFNQKSESSTKITVEIFLKPCSSIYTIYSDSTYAKKVEAERPLGASGAFALPSPTDTWTEIELCGAVAGGNDLPQK